MRIHSEDYVTDICNILEQARNTIYRTINTTMVMAYYLIGKRIVEQEQSGIGRAGYGQMILKTLSERLTRRFGKGFSIQSLYNFRLFYERFNDPTKFSTTWRILTWSHYRLIMREATEQARIWYCNQACSEMWDVRTLERNINTQYRERILASQQQDLVHNEMVDKTTRFQQEKLSFIKNPYVIEFLGLPSTYNYTEHELEQALIDNIEKFILELGRGFAFIERQKLIRTETSDFYIDLVFYNYILKCFFLIDLKIGKLTHQDVGQMDMYVRMYDDLKRGDGDNPTIGLLLCSQTDKTIVKYSVLNDNQQLFAAKYLTIIPSEEELMMEIARQKDLFQESNNV